MPVVICSIPKFKQGLHKSRRNYVILDVLSITPHVTFGTKGLVNTLNIDALTNVFQFYKGAFSVHLFVWKCRISWIFMRFLVDLFDPSF